MATSRQSLKRFLSYVRPYRRLLASAIACGIVRYLIPLALPWTVKILVDDFFTAGSRRPHVELHWLMAGLCGLYAIYAIASYWRSYLAGRAGHRLIFDLRQGLYLHLQRMSLSFFDRQKIGAVISRMTTDIASAQNFVGAAFVNTIMDLACVAVIIGVLFAAHVELALVSLAVLPFYAWVSFHLQKRIKEKSRAIHHQLQEISGDLHEQFAGISTIQAFTQEEAEAREFRVQSEEYFETVMGNVRLQSIALGVTGFLTALGPILVLWVGAAEVWSGQITVGTLMAFYGYLGMLYQPIQRLTELNLILANSLAAMDRIFEVFDTFPEVQEHPGAKPLPRVRGEIRFEDVSFRYAQREIVLERLELVLPAGTTTALVGPSGAGKSTLVKLLPRFYDVTGGRIMIDGFDLRQVTLKSLREQIAIVSQEPILFSGTIAENLRYGRPSATDDEMRASARAAFADSFIQQLPQGYETEIGERGVRLSGGQKQRLAIARAFLKDAPILILDEPTSALDPESEQLVKQALNRLLEGRTALIIAHRLSTIEHADTVVVLDSGRIIEHGRHAELLKRPGGLYRRYAGHQLTSSLL
ncbi:MAG: ABC transporter ATP-binding protein [Candidatus Omnitrophica bacterium CG11_big_fil_rev_8_21_14_0_20_63_9]|nr:MAG: ABC transporter ATP-binding protein [Candidatus Omnitrophica bacterium CG11_big_fil_rev_8_21_14_0_20_63_9]